MKTVVALCIQSLLLLFSTGAAPSSPVVHFDHPRALSSEPFDLRLEADAPDAPIVYTLDGSVPSPQNGTTYSDPIRITGTSAVRAAVIADGHVGPPTTHSYIYPEQVAKQNGATLPQTWGAKEGKLVPATYGLSPQITEDPKYRDELPRALRAIPTMSIVMDAAELFGADGIYTHPEQNGADWERKGSVELIEPDGSPGFATDCGVRIHGGWSRRPEESPKHGFRLLFKVKHGSGKLTYPLFGADGSKELTTLVLRNGNNNSWLHPSSEERKRAEYIRDQWMRDSHRAMGYPSARGTFVHLYLNGLYWGVYNVTERPDAAFAAANFGGSPKAYDVLRADKPLEGDRQAWNKMIAVVNAGLTTESAYGALQAWLDPTEFADFMILNFYGANSDWDGSSNWYAIRRRPSGKFHFVVWDGERTLEGLDANTMAFDSDSSPPRMFQKLRENAEFRALFAERARKLCSRDGPLGPQACAARFKGWSSMLESAIIGESARWGSYRKDVNSFRTGPYELYTRDEHWRPEVNRLLNDYFPHRTQVVLKQFQEQGLYAPAAGATDAPSRSSLGDFDSRTDVGHVEHAGTAEYLAEKREYRVTGSGANIWGAEDAFCFVYRKLSGDATISADIAFPNPGRNAHRKACLMVRQSLDADAPYADVAVHGDGLISLQMRKTKGGQTTELQSPIKGAATITISRSGNEFAVTVKAKQGEPKSLGPVTVELNDPVYVGLAVSSHERDLSETAVFSDVKVVGK
jgi:hypothetical protein